MFQYDETLLKLMVFINESEIRTEVEVEVEVEVELVVTKGQPLSNCDITAFSALPSTYFFELLSIQFIDLFLFFVYCFNWRKGTGCLLKTLLFSCISSSFVSTVISSFCIACKA